MTTESNEPEYEIIDPATNKPIEDKSKKASPKAEPKEEEVSETNKFEMPEKFKGKSPEEIAKAFVENEKLMGRQAQELGSLRKAQTEMQAQVHEIIQRELEQSKQASEADQMEAELEYGDLVDKPEESIRKVVNKDIEKMRKELDEMRSMTAQEKLEAKHPNFLETAQSPEFQDWVSKSQFRTRMFYAANEGDFTAADELFSEYATSNPAPKQEDTSKRDQALRGASTESGSATGTAKKKLYRSSDLIKMRISDPDGYASRSEEFNAAYREGRVINDVDKVY